MGSYRDRLDIIADMLHIASKNAKKTQIMYQANLSYKVLQKYLAEVTDAQLIDFEDETQRYSLTEKGREFLDAYEKYSKTSRYVEKKLSDVEGRRKGLEELCTNDQ